MLRYLLKILTPLVASAMLVGATPAALAQGVGDDVLLDMQQAFRKGDKRRLSALLPAVRGHVLEPWAAYWELRARLNEAQPQEVADFLARYAGTYQEDRLRNDWLLLLGARRDWASFAALHPQFRMNDDREVRCHALTIAQIEGTSTQDAPAELLRNWYALRDADDGCSYAAGQFYTAGRLEPDDIWRKARLAMDANRPGAARRAVEIVAPDALPQFAALADSPAKFLASRATALGKLRKELVVLALGRMAANDPDTAASLLDSKWAPQLTREERNWLWGAIGRQSAQKLSPEAAGYFARVTRDADLTDDMLAWKTRAALRAGDWKSVLSATRAMSAEARQDPAWTYWQARALLAGRPTESARAEAGQLLAGIAGFRGFYEQLALEDLGQRITLPPRPEPATAAELEAARRNPGLQRALYAIRIGLRSEGVREWNYTTNLHDKGGMADRELLAAAELACRQQVWDRCINTSDRTRDIVDVEQRFPMPFHDAVLRRAGDIGIDPAYVYGLIRQESRFVMDARSGVGASGLMQVMPATARWTARRIGLAGFSPEQITDRDTNIVIGAAYLKLALDDFDGSMALAAAAYNAGPGLPRVWRNGPVLDAAIWAENVPFAETRDYVKKVLSNTVNYAALISGQPQSLRARLGTVGPRDAARPEPNRDLP
ncbi:lytic transglycosylase domain-containing protein [Xylophilus sp.]|uniref:lytic transglycosylase domain-containing protein n=1 Tax=Xylophilus sp. TaxID=2653893 RepID=UPI0013BCC812|nr:lytic transglycosylase domain-containing protein [Xylophilus sp.]KAF1046188.1 MAG: Soluble lytic murein transglycosylase [Xylophilus sp.]